MLAAGYIGLTIIMILIITFGLKKHLNKIGTVKSIQARYFILFFLGLGIWLIYLLILSENKTLQNLELPPRFFYLLLGPFFVFSILFYIINRKNSIIQSIPLKWTIILQTFRIGVEIIILFTFFENILPKSATFEGYNFDIIIGLTAPLIYVAYIKTKSNYLLYIWNFIGISMIIFVGIIVATSTYKPEFWGANKPLVALDFFVMPYLLLAGFLAPLGIFLHVVNLIQLRKN